MALLWLPPPVDVRCVLPPVFQAAEPSLREGAVGGVVDWVGGGVVLHPLAVEDVALRWDRGGDVEEFVDVGEEECVGRGDGDEEGEEAREDPYLVEAMEDCSWFGIVEAWKS